MIQRVTALLGGAALVGGDRAVGVLVRRRRSTHAAMAQGVGAFTAADVALLDEIAETILPGDVDARREGGEDRRVHGADGHRRLHRARRSRCSATACGSSTRRARPRTGVAFMQATPAQRLTLLEALDREQKTAMEERANAPRSRAPAAAAAPDDARALLPHDEGAGAARLLHLRDRLHAGDALRRVARPLRSVRAARARRQVVAARLAAEAHGTEHASERS